MRMKYINYYLINKTNYMVLFSDFYNLQESMLGFVCTSTQESSIIVHLNVKAHRQDLITHFDIF